MADLTVGEVNKILQLNLTYVDETVSPPVLRALDLTNATVKLLYAITDQKAKPKVPVNRVMTIAAPATSGIVQYSFQSGDLVKPAEMGEFGVFRYVVEVTYPDGTVLYSSDDGQLTIKDGALL